MTRLEIKNTLTGTTYVPHLPNDFSFEVQRDNPLFTHKGDYTYDIQISLKDPHNRAIYSHIDRLTADRYPQNRKARIIVDGHCVCDGTEVILKMEDDIAHVQIVAGYSEMNYLTASDSLKIREMNFGTAETPTVEMAKTNSKKFFPEANFVFPMLCKGSSTSAGYVNEYQRQMYDGCNADGVEYVEDTTLWPQPYVLFIVEKFIELLGYEIEENMLRDDERWKRLVLISGYNTLDYAKMLPDWTAAQFLTEIERFFNCVVLTDPTSKKAKIITAKKYYEEAAEIYEVDDEEIIDNFLCEFDMKEVDLILANDNLKYQLPSGSYWHYKNLEDSVINKSASIWTNIENARAIEDNDWQIYTHGNYQFVFTKDRNSDGDVIMKRCWLVNEYKHKTNSEKQWNEMKIIPAQTFVRFYRPSGTYDAERHHIGIISAFPEYYDNSASNDFSAIISEKTKESAGDTMQVAFFTGLTKAMIISQYEGDTLSVSNYWICMLQTTPDMITMTPFITDANGNYLYQQYHKLTSLALVDQLTLSLDGNYGRYSVDFNTNEIADFSKKITLSFATRKLLKSYDLFLIKGKKFVCQQLKYNYQDGKQKAIVEGIFYPYI